MKVRVIRQFNDKAEGFITRPVNETYECSDERAKQLIDGGFAAEVKPNATENEPNAPKKPRAKKTESAD